MAPKKKSDIVSKAAGVVRKRLGMKPRPGSKEAKEQAKNAEIRRQQQIKLDWHRRRRGNIDDVIRTILDKMKPIPRRTKKERKEPRPIPRQAKKKKTKKKAKKKKRTFKFGLPPGM